MPTAHPQPQIVLADIVLPTFCPCGTELTTLFDLEQHAEAGHFEEVAAK